jgi:hypothetical protein
MSIHFHNLRGVLARHWPRVVRVLRAPLLWAAVLFAALLLAGGLVFAEALERTGPRPPAYDYTGGYTFESRQAVCPGEEVRYTLETYIELPEPVVFDADQVEAAIVAGEEVAPLVSAPEPLTGVRTVYDARTLTIAPGFTPQMFTIAPAVNATTSSRIVLPVPATARPGLYYVSSVGYVDPTAARGRVVFFLVRDDCEAPR